MVGRISVKKFHLCELGLSINKLSYHWSKIRGTPRSHLSLLMAPHRVPHPKHHCARTAMLPCCTVNAWLVIGPLDLMPSLFFIVSTIPDNESREQKDGWSVCQKCAHSLQSGTDSYVYWTTCQLSIQCCCRIQPIINLRLEVILVVTQNVIFKISLMQPLIQIVNATYLKIHIL